MRFAPANRVFVCVIRRRHLHPPVIVCASVEGVADIPLFGEAQAVGVGSGQVDVAAELQLLSMGSDQHSEHIVVGGCSSGVHFQRVQ